MRQLRISKADGSLDDTFLANARQKADETGREIEAALNVTARPDVDVSALERALAIARMLKSDIASIGRMSSGISNDLGVEMRRNFSDGAMP